MPALDGLEAESAFPPWSLRICPACGEAGAAEAEAAAAAARLARRRLGRWRRPAWECHEAWRRPQRAAVPRAAVRRLARSARWLAPFQLGCRIGRLAERLPII